tara:strand:- start:4122 stop:4844 length:723 start_codon:yes stop_codon:yes gene_type:complete
MANNLLQMAQPASTNVHNNIDNLILQAELDKKQFGGVSYYGDRQDFPIDMVKYANFMSKANMSKAISELKSDITQEGQEKLSDLTQEVINRMRLGDAPKGIIAYRSEPKSNIRGQYYPAKNPLYAPDTIRIFEPTDIRYKKNGLIGDYPTETLLHEPLHGIRTVSSPNKLLFHREQKGFTQSDFNRYEQNMIQSLSDYLGNREKVFKEAEALWQPQLKGVSREAYLRRVRPYNSIENILK